MEARNAYGYYGTAGGYTGERRPENKVRMTYRNYKQNFADHETVIGSYNEKDKTIEVVFTDEEMKKKTNLGNRYQIETFYFLTDISTIGISPVIEVKAKSIENATRNAKAWAKREGFSIIKELTYAEYWGYKKGR